MPLSVYYKLMPSSVDYMRKVCITGSKLLCLGNIQIYGKKMDLAGGR